VSVHLLDTNLLIALAWPQHIHHTPAHDWFNAMGRHAWATCPITELSFIRLSSNPSIIPAAVSPREAVDLLRRIKVLPGHRFWPDEITPIEAPVFDSVAFVGHRQVTDAYLLALSQHHGGKLATFDAGIAQLIPAAKKRSQYLTLVI
jgi:toxin-antitoxin system PIN domain toxin